MKISMKIIFTGVMFFLISLSSKAQDCVAFYFESSDDGGDLIVEIKVKRFTDITSTQFAFSYSASNLILEEIDGNLDIGFTSDFINSASPGYVALSWSNAIMGQSLTDESVLLSMRFTKTDAEASDFIFDANFNTEIIDGNFEELCYEFTPLTVNDPNSFISGRLMHDLNNNCLLDAEDLPLAGWTVKIEDGFETYYRLTDHSGYYSYSAPFGTFIVTPIMKNELWESCLVSDAVFVDSEGETYNVPFMISAKDNASAMEVNVSTSRLRRCFDNTYNVRYKNNGTAKAENARIEIDFDEHLSYISSSATNFNLVGQIATVNLGDVEPGEEGIFKVVMNVDCSSTELGQTVCTRAEVFSDDQLFPPTEWNGAVLTTNVKCEGDSVVFSIKNIGEDMLVPMDFIVVEDDVMFGTNQIILEGESERTFKYLAGNGVYRLRVDQEQDYPLGNFSTDFLESCTGNKNDTYRFVSMFQNNDESPYVDIECHGLVGSFDPNDKIAYPVGYREEHFINRNEDLEFTIRFQNTGTDTAFTVSVVDVIDPSLDITSLIPGPSSHGYILSIKENKELRFDFLNIKLPDSLTNMRASHGYVKYRISQNANLPEGTVIENMSSIYFDFNPPIETNTTDHMIGEDFIEIILDDQTILLDNELILAPNPAYGIMRIEVPSTYDNVDYLLYDTQGKLVTAANSPNNVFYLERGILHSGMYILELRSEGKTIGRKKIIFQDR